MRRYAPSLSSRIFSIWKECNIKAEESGRVEICWAGSEIVKKYMNTVQIWKQKNERFERRRRRLNYEYKTILKYNDEWRLVRSLWWRYIFTFYGIFDQNLRWRKSLSNIEHEACSFLHRFFDIVIRYFGTNCIGNFILRRPETNYGEKEWNRSSPWYPCRWHQRYGGSLKSVKAFFRSLSHVFLESLEDSENNFSKDWWYTTTRRKCGH